MSLRRRKLRITQPNKTFKLQALDSNRLSSIVLPVLHGNPSPINVSDLENPVLKTSSLHKHQQFILNLSSKNLPVSRQPSPSTKLESMALDRHKQSVKIMNRNIDKLHRWNDFKQKRAKIIELYTNLKKKQLRIRWFIGSLRARGIIELLRNNINETVRLNNHRLHKVMLVIMTSNKWIGRCKRFGA